MSVILCILDGWGAANAQEPQEFNAIAAAKIPCYDFLMKEFPHSLIATSGLAVGLPAGQMGNSEVGHMTIGSGRINYHDLIRANTALEKPEENKALYNFAQKLKKTKGTCHIIGLLSDGGVHSHASHIYKLIDYFKLNNISYVLHAFTDGRDTPPQSALKYLKGKDIDIGTVSGRYYSMDRDNRWDRTELAYLAILKGLAQKKFLSAQECINYYYKNNITDEFIPPSVIGTYNGIKPADSLLIANFRADRIRQLTSLFTSLFQQNQNSCNREDILTMTQYFSSASEPIISSASSNANIANIATNLANISTILSPIELKNTLGKIIAKNNLAQLRLAETEKYAHVTYFFNGNQHAKYNKEEQILIPSPMVATYDLQAEMSAYKITEALVPAILSKKFALIVVNYANADMVGHTGNFPSTVKAIEAIDQCLKKVTEAVEQAEAILLVTADHGNAECMYDSINKMPYTAHTLNPVPFILVDKSHTAKMDKRKLIDGTLADIAPTILQLLNIPKPKEMTGQSLLADLVEKGC